MKSSVLPAHSITGWLRRDGSRSLIREPGSCTVVVSTGSSSATPFCVGNDGATSRPSQGKALPNTSGKVSDSLLAL